MPPKRQASENLALLLKAGANLNARAKDGYTPLMEAARNESIYTQKTLIDTGADLNIVNGKSAYLQIYD